MLAYKSLKSSQAVHVMKERYKVCTGCGNFTYILDQQKYCNVCGDEYISECKNCNEPIIYPTAKFCPVCSESLRRDKKALPNNIL